jgi:hypothetical protein
MPVPPPSWRGDPRPRRDRAPRSVAGRALAREQERGFFSRERQVHVRDRLAEAEALGTDAQGRRIVSLPGQDAAERRELACQAARIAEVAEAGHAILAERPCPAEIAKACGQCGQDVDGHVEPHSIRRAGIAATIEITHLCKTGEQSFRRTSYTQNDTAELTL